MASVDASKGRGGGRGRWGRVRRAGSALPCALSSWLSTAHAWLLNRFDCVSASPAGPGRPPACGPSAASHKSCPTRPARLVSAFLNGRECVGPSTRAHSPGQDVGCATCSHGICEETAAFLHLNGKRAQLAPRWGGVHPAFCRTARGPRR